MPKIRKLVFSFAILIGCLSGYSNSVPEEVKTIFSMIYNQQFSEADSMLKNAAGDFDNFYYDILKLDLYYWEYSVESTTEKSDQLKQYLADFSSKEDSTINTRLKELIFLSYSVRYELKRFNIPGAVILRSKIKNLLAEINRKTLDYPENRMKLFDLYNLLFQYFDNVFNPFFLDSKRNERKNALKKIEIFASDDDLIVNTLANYFLGKIYLNIEKEPRKSKVHLEFLLNKYPNNLSIRELLDHCNNKI